MKKLTALIMSCIMLFSLAGCNKGAGDDKNVTVRFLNFKPEIASVYNEIVQAYKEETGVTVIVDTAANNTYESTLAARMGTSEAPTIFQINGPRGYANWSDYCKDLTDSKLYSHLNDKSMAVTKDGKVVTPKSPSILPSITRRSLMTVARDYLGLECEEREVPFAELGEMAECGLCGTAAVISPVGTIVDHGKEIHYVGMGPTIQKLYDTLTGIQMGRLEAPEGWIRIIE